MTSPLLSAQGLGLKIEERWLIKNLDLHLHPGSFVAITGSSGSGKTSLLRALGGEIVAAEGTVTNKLDCPNRLAMIFQDLQLADGATAVTNVLGGALSRYSFLSTLWRFPSEEQRQAKLLLSEFGLSEKANQWTSTLSVVKDSGLPLVARFLLARSSFLLTNLYQALIQLWPIKF